MSLCLTGGTESPPQYSVFCYLGIMTTNDARCTREIKSRIAMTEAAFNKKKTVHWQIGLRFKEETSKVLHVEHSLVWR
jgi:hypothetical protein